jgi:hypothetical protein
LFNLLDLFVELSPGAFDGWEDLLCLSRRVLQITHFTRLTQPLGCTLSFPVCTKFLLQFFALYQPRRLERDQFPGMRTLEEPILVSPYTSKGERYRLVRMLKRWNGNGTKVSHRGRDELE